jgi:hypothetical protein
MHGFLVEEVMTLVGSGVQTLSQGANGWVDLRAYQDVVAWLLPQEIKANGGTLQFGYQTAALPEEASFITMTGPTVTVPFTPTAGTQQITVMLKDLMTVPLARWFRWQLIATGQFSGPWDITFSLRLSANCLRRERGRERGHGSLRKEHGHVR